MNLTNRNPELVPAQPPSVVAGTAAAFIPYPGAIDFGKTPHVGTDEAPSYGYLTWSDQQRDSTPFGNPFSLNRVAPPQAAPPCHDDDALTFLDADEQMALQLTARHDSARVQCPHRYEIVSTYVMDELDERENKIWWSVHET